MERVLNIGTQKHTKVVSVDKKKYNTYHQYHVKTVKDDICVSVVYFQRGPVKECGLNGVHNEDLIAMVIDRLECFQNSEYKCEENQKAIGSLKTTLKHLRDRTNKRAKRGVEGTSVV